MSSEEDDSDDEQVLFRFNNDHGTAPDLIYQVFCERGWKEWSPSVHSESEWSIWWRSVHSAISNPNQLMPWQRVHHFPKSDVFSRKDCLARILKRMTHSYPNYDFYPRTFILPNDYPKFARELLSQGGVSSSSRAKSSVWICKPSDSSCGRGIFLFRKLPELSYNSSAVVQEYVVNPLLVSGYKFDLRIYVLVPSFAPLTIYIYEEGLVRFGTEKYDLKQLGNVYSHLTNTSINKLSPTYAKDKEGVGLGCKWTLTQLRHYFHQSNVDDRLIWHRIINLVTLTLLAECQSIPKTQNCFELLGFDILIDRDLKAWLLEINLCPSMTIDCKLDSDVKRPLIHDLLDFLKIRGSPEEYRLKSAPLRRPEKSALQRPVSRYQRPRLSRELTTIRPKSAVGTTSSESSSSNVKFFLGLSDREDTLPEITSSSASTATATTNRVDQEEHDLISSELIAFKQVKSSMPKQESTVSISSDCSSHSADSGFVDEKTTPFLTTDFNHNVSQSVERKNRKKLPVFTKLAKQRQQQQQQRQLQLQQQQQHFGIHHHRTRQQQQEQQQEQQGRKSAIPSGHTRVSFSKRDEVKKTEWPKQSGGFVRIFPFNQRVQLASEKCPVELRDIMQEMSSLQRRVEDTVSANKHRTKRCSSFSDPIFSLDEYSFAALWGPSRSSTYFTG